MNSHDQTPVRGHGLAKWGSIIYLTANFVFIGAFVVMLEFVDFSSGAVTPGSSEDTLGMVLASSTMLFTGVQHVSLLMILGALFARKFRAPWFYYASNVSSVFMLCSVGGPILAILVSRYLHQNRSEFFATAAETPSPLSVQTEPETLKTSVNSAHALEPPDFAALLEENRRLKTLVAEQALQLQERNSR